jgi:hypothetical protein
MFIHTFQGVAMFSYLFELVQGVRFFRFLKWARILVFAFGGLMLIVPTLMAKDLWVRAEADGDGQSLRSPAPFLWRMMERAERGDIIHVAEGTYYGKGESGSFLVKTPHLTLVGGYCDNFSTRNPFLHPTVLLRGPGFKGNGLGIPRAHLSGDEHRDHSGLIVDGFILDSQSRNVYKADGQINTVSSWEGPGVAVMSPSITLRNLIIINTFGPGITGRFAGSENHIENCFIVNSFYAGISLVATRPGTQVLIKNNTISFNWFRVNMGGGHGIIVGNQGVIALERNVIAYIQTEDASYGHGVTNLRGNIDLSMKENTFFQCQTSYYRYMDDDNRNLMIYRSSELDDLNANPEDYMLLSASGNTNRNPVLKPEKNYFSRFSAFVGSQPGKLNMDQMNQLRRMLGVSLQAGKSSPRENYGMAYPRAKVIPNLVTPVTGIGARTDVHFPIYRSQSEKAVEKSFREVDFNSFKRGTATVKSFQAEAISFKAGMGSSSHTYLLKQAPDKDYLCFKLLRPGQTDFTRDYIFGYILKGSSVHRMWLKLYKRRGNYNRSGITFKGQAFYTGDDSYTFPVGLVIESIER